MIKSRLCNYRDAYIYVKETIAIPNTGTHTAPNNVGKKVTFKNCAPFFNCISKNNNTKIDDVNDTDVVMSNIF